MSTVTKSLTTVNQVSAILTLQPGQSATYDLSGTFVQTDVLQSSRNGGLSWETVASATAAASGTVKNEQQSDLWLRWKCAADTSGTGVAVIADVADLVGEVRNAQGDLLMRTNEESVDVLVRTAQKRVINVGAKVGTTAGFVVNAGDNLGLLATCPASQTGSTLVIPVPGLKVGDTITAFHLIGQIESAGGTVTVDAALRKLTTAAADVADASVGAITQLSATADTIMSASNTRKASLAEVVAADETFYILITVTTGASTDIALQGVAIEITEA